MAATAAGMGTAVAPVALTSFNHFTRVVRDLDVAAAFYERVLGFVPTARPPFRVPGRWLFHRTHPAQRPSRAAPPADLVCRRAYACCCLFVRGL
jgi:hypothetical protein